MSEAFYTDKARVRAAFERAATSYDSAAVLQREVSDRMAERLTYIKHEPAVILDAGSGTGYGAAQLRERYPNARVIELDLAAAMLKASRTKQQDDAGFFGRLLGKARSSWQVCGDLEALPLADQSVDMIWSNLAIQWVNVPDSVFAEFRRILKPDGLVMFSTLGPDTLQELRTSFAGVDGATHVNQFIDMHDLGDALVRTGFGEPVMDMDKIVLTYDDARGVMQDLKAIGAHNATGGRGRGLMGKHAWQQVCAAYELRRCDGKLPATYEVVYGHAWFGRPKQQANLLPDGRQVIEFKKPGQVPR